MNTLLLVLGLVLLFSPPLKLCNSQCIEKKSNAEYTVIRDECNHRTWQEAEDYCSEVLSSHLATILNDEWNDYAFEARNLLEDPPGISEDAWIGLTDQAEEGRWVWTEGHEAYNYSNWFKGEPNDYDGNQDCVIMGAFSKRWDDQDCM